jgi:monoamine oxidase
MMGSPEDWRSTFDTVIVGAGLAGLSAAHELRGRNILVLEKEPRPGGRVLTRHHAGVAYDLGALFAYQEHALRVPKLASRSIPAQGPVGLFQAGKLHLGRTVIECIRNTGLAQDQMNAFLEFRQTKDTASLVPGAYAIANAFFQVIHPGEMQEYVPERRADSLKTFAPHHHERGNGVLVQHLAEQLGHQLVLDADVRLLDDRDDHVQVQYEAAGEVRSVKARSALVCTPAPVTRSLLTRLNDESRYFLESVDYRGGLVVVLGCPRQLVSSFSYLVAVDARPNTVVRQDRGDVCLLTCYYVGAQARELAEKPRDQIIRETIAGVSALGLGLTGPEQVRFADVQHWPRVGPVFSERMRAYHHPRALRPSERVFLAGDYTQGTDLPYGMGPAMQSGHRAAAEVQAFLHPPVTIRGPAQLPRMAPLLDAYRYRLHDEQPVFIDRRSEGDIAFYGLLLQAEPGDERLRDYLLENRRDGLWEYHKGYGVTAEDSTLVIEGLWQAGVSRDVLEASLQRLVAHCFDEQVGAFHTIPFARQGRAGYWRGPSIDATAHAGYLLQAMAADRFATAIRRCAEYLRARQSADGRFAGRWFPSWTWTTYHAVRLLQAQGETDAAQRAHWALLRGQADDGSWQHSVIDTSAAVLALGVLDAGDPAIERGRAWLRAREQRHGWVPEAVLYYWFEPRAGSMDADASLGAGFPRELASGGAAGWYDNEASRRIFFHAMDRGRITNAWARLALKSQMTRSP